MLASWNTYLIFAGGTSDFSWSIWSGWTSWTWNLGEQFEPDKGNFMWPRVEILEQQILKLLEALEIRTLSPLYLHSAEIQRSDHWLPSVECPVLILHAADDVKVNRAKRSIYFSICNDKRHFIFLPNSKLQAWHFLLLLFPTQVPPELSERLFEETVLSNIAVHSLWVMITQRWSDDHLRWNGDHSGVKWWSLKGEVMITQGEMMITQRWRRKRMWVECSWIKTLALDTT